MSRIALRAANFQAEVVKRALSAPSALRLVKDGLILEAQLTLPTHFFSFVLKLTLKVHWRCGSAFARLLRCHGFERHRQLFSQTTPIPAALQLFSTGLGALGLLGWRRRIAQFLLCRSLKDKLA